MDSTGFMGRNLFANIYSEWVEFVGSIGGLAFLTLESLGKWSLARTDGTIGGTKFIFKSLKGTISKVIQLMERPI